MIKPIHVVMVILVCILAVRFPRAQTGPSLKWDEDRSSTATGYIVTMDGVRTDYGLSPVASDGSCGCSIAVPFSGGSHTFTVTAYNKSASTTSATFRAALTANAGGPYTGTVGTAISVSAAGSSNPYGSIALYVWSWGDGSTTSGTSTAASHKYTTAGSFTVRVTVTDPTGGTATATTTATTTATAPPPTGASTVIVRAASVAAGAIHGAWQQITDSTASGGSALWNPNNGQAKIVPALASPPNYWTATFTANAGVAYHLWVRIRAQSNSMGNDSVHVQFSDSIDAGGSPIMRVGTAGSAEIVLQNGSADPSVHGWGWADNGWGVLGAHVHFAATGTHTVRVQQREDGAIVDELLLSPDTFLTVSPGTRDDDTVKK
jgi:PKD domain